MFEYRLDTCVLAKYVSEPRMLSFIAFASLIYKSVIRSDQPPISTCSCPLQLPSYCLCYISCGVVMECFLVGLISSVSRPQGHWYWLLWNCLTCPISLLHVLNMYVYLVLRFIFQTWLTDKLAANQYWVTISFLGLWISSDEWDYHPHAHDAPAWSV